MRDTSSSWYPDEHEPVPGHGQRRRHHGPFKLLRNLVTIGGRLGRAPRERTSAEITTQANPGRGEALRDAHRTLRQHMHTRPALRAVAPHLSLIERSLGKHGSRALLKLPLSVMRRGLEQLAMLQHDDESEEEAGHLRVLRLRLMEALTLRGSRPRGDSSHTRKDPGAGVEVRHISVDEYNRAVEVSMPPKLDKLRSRH